jgi:hypothetical protein
MMRELAEAFVEASAEAGDSVGWETRDASKLDAVCDRFLATEPSARLQLSMVVAMGAYLGELMVRHGNGRWAEGSGPMAVVELANGVVADPHEQVAKRLQPGAQNDLGVFFHYALAGLTDLDAALAG